MRSKLTNRLTKSIEKGTREALAASFASLISVACDPSGELLVGEDGGYGWGSALRHLDLPVAAFSMPSSIVCKGFYYQYYY